MPKYKRYELSFVKSLSEEQRTVRHSRTPFRGARGVPCEECGESLPAAHSFAGYGCCCVRCWNGLVEVSGWEGVLYG